MESLESRGWRDAWIERNRSTRPPGTRFSPNGGNPFRLDHAILSPAAKRAKSVDYPDMVGDRSVLEAPNVSDHLPLTIRF